jgi:hypothetical protein
MTNSPGFQRFRLLALGVVVSALTVLPGCATTQTAQQVFGQKILGPQLMGVLGLNNKSAQDMANTHYPTESPGTPQIQRFDPPPLNHGSPISFGYFLDGETRWPSMPPREGIADLPTLSGAYNMRVGRTIQCTYGPDDNRRIVYFWDNVRPIIDTRIPREDLNKWAAKRRITADVAVINCPSTWGDALTFVWGESAWQTLQASPGAIASRTALQADFAQAAAERRHAEILEERRAAALAKLPDRERCLITRGVKHLDDNYDRLTPLGRANLQLACGQFPRP